MFNLIIVTINQMKKHSVADTNTVTLPLRNLR